MTRLMTRAASAACSALLTLALVACGGGSGSTESGAVAQAIETDAAQSDALPNKTALAVKSIVATATASPALSKTVQSATVNADGPATSLVIRAYGVLAGGTGPVVRVLVDGVEAATTEVRSTTPEDIRVDVPALHPGSKVDLVYTNDATVGGVDRNLFITQVRAGDTYILPTSPGVTVDWGAGAAALDGINVGPGQGAFWGSGALRIVWPGPNLTDRLTLRASGKSAAGVQPRMALVVDGIQVGQVDVSNTAASDYVFAVPPLKVGSKVDVVALNTGIVDGQERSIELPYARAATTVALPAAAGNVFDMGSGAAAFDGISTQQGSAKLAVPGALRLKWPAPNMTDTLTVRAGGQSTDAVLPRMEVRVDGVVLGTVELASAGPADYVFAALPMAAGKLVEAVLANADAAGARTINVRQATSAKTFLLAKASELRGTWPQPNITGTLTVGASGTLAAGMGPLMQVYVDNLFVGQAEVQGTALNDYTFAVPTLTPGSKVEVVYTNDAQIAGADRNLFVSYLVSGLTSVLPGAPGSVFDRGAGASAFDGLDLLPAARSVYSNGALRFSWPAPNITDTLTVRASSVLAGNVGALLQLRVDGVTISSVEVRATEPTDYQLPVPPLKPGASVELVFANPGTVDGITRSLAVAYLKSANTVVAVPASVGPSFAATSSWQLTWPAANLTETLTVRASGTLAGNVGPMMQVRVDGVVLGSQEVRSTQLADYSFAAPVLKEGSKVDVVFTNDANISGQDRNLFVAYVISGKTVLRPTAAGVVYDRGSGQAAFDGADLLPGQSTLGWNGALRGSWPAPNLTDRLVVRASATVVDGTGAQMQVLVDGVVTGRAEIRSAEPADYEFDVPPLAKDSKVDVQVTNLATVNGVQRRLVLASMLSGQTVVHPEAAGNTFDRGVGDAAFDGLNTTSATGDVRENGALRVRWPMANMTDTLVVRAAGTMAGGVGPVMQLRVDGIVLGKMEVRSAQPSDFSFATTPLKPGSQVDVVYVNDGVVGTEDRNLTVAYMLSGTTAVQSSASTVQFDQGSGLAAFDGANVVAGRPLLNVNGALRTIWPAPNMTSSITVRARGELAGGVGPTMQVFVDGVLVGTADVKNTDFGDFTFACTPLQAGGRVDVLYANDMTINGQDRNLHVAYAVSDRTFVLPSSTAARYDRGAGLAAFDGADVIAGQGAMLWNGALRMTWPGPNITDNLTIRASGTVAGNIGPLMQVRVDGVVVSSVEVRSDTPVDYLMPVPPLKQGSKIDVIYANDAVVNGIDRNLRVAYLFNGKTFVKADAPEVKLDLGSGNAAFDGQDMLPGQANLAVNGALRMAWPAPNIVDTVTVRASATLANNVGAMMQLRVNGVIMGSVEVRSTTPADYTFAVPAIKAGSQIDIAYINDATINGQDRNLFVQFMRAGGVTMVPSASGVVVDQGIGEAAFDGISASAGIGDGALYGPAALRFKVPTLPASDGKQAARYAASRFLQQATFGPTPADIERMLTTTPSAWITEQMAIPASPDYVNFVQSKFDLGDAYRPNGANYTSGWVGQQFWKSAATSPDQLRKRVAFALHQIFMVSQADSSLYFHSRAYADYLDTLNRRAFGNFRNLLEDIALSPVMGIYLSHMRNRPEDPATGRLPDENFAREVMQLFTIGLHELNIDGTPKLDSRGLPIETYSIQDVMAMAKVFTGWSWGFPDSQLTEWTFRFGAFDYSMAKDQRIDLQRMKAYPGMHSTAEKRLFAGKPHAVTIPAYTSANDSLRIALDTLFNHPNVGPFIGRQLIQHLVTSNPSPAYVARVAAVFNNNGAGVRGDLSAVVRAVLLDTEASNPTAGALGKLREPVLRVTHWMRSFGATSLSGQYLMAYELDNQSQRALYAPSVFGYFRPGFVPPNTSFSASNTTVPEFQIVSESTTGQWVNLAMAMTTSGLGWTGTGKDVSASLDPLVSLAAASDVDGLIERLNLLLYAGRMSSTLRQDLVDAVTAVPGSTAAANLNRARIALFLALAAPEYLVQH